MEREREEGDKEGEDEGKKESLRKTKESRGPRHKTFFLERSHCPFIKKTASYSKPVCVHKGRRTVTTSSLLMLAQ